MINDVLLNIVVPVYNSSKYIQEFILILKESLIQTGISDKVKIIFCDDCSDDSTVFILENEMKKSNIHFTIIQQKKNVGQNINTLSGINECNVNKYCLTMDADMQPSPEVLKIFIPYCLNNLKECVVGDFNPHGWGWRRIYSFIYSLYLASKTQYRIINHYGSSLRWFYLDETLKSNFKQKRIDETLLNHFPNFEFYSIKDKYLSNLSIYPQVKLFKDIFRKSNRQLF